jgi:hypothetical protein
VRKLYDAGMDREAKTEAIPASRPAARPDIPRHGERGEPDAAGTRQRRKAMQLYVIRRRNYWKTAAELETTAARSRHVGDKEMPDKVRWIRSYAVSEANGTLGTVCIYQAVSPEAIREHAARTGMPADEIVPVAATVIVRPDPKEAQVAAA